MKARLAGFTFPLIQVDWRECNLDVLDPGAPTINVSINSSGLEGVQLLGFESLAGADIQCPNARTGWIIAFVHQCFLYCEVVLGC